MRKATDTEPQEKPKSILEMSADEARTFLMKGESYCSIPLPPYFVFDKLLSEAHECLRKQALCGNPNSDHAVNHTILSNKDGKFAWRPLQLVHPALYISLVCKLTEPEKWDLLRKRFCEFRKNESIRCMSIPVESKTTQKDNAEQILQWWQEIEQRSIEISLDYEYIACTDIADCYGSIYTHSIPWALHGKNKMKLHENRNKLDFLGNAIDKEIRRLNRGQTNGIPQGSVLMDFIAEIVLGYADKILSKKLEDAKVEDYQILRYRDDYRVFSNHPRHAEEILKLISETIYSLGMRLNPFKTGIKNEVIRHSIKSDKIEWMSSKQRDKILQKHLLLIHSFSGQHPNSGSLVKAMDNFHRRLLKDYDDLSNALPMIAITVDIARKKSENIPALGSDHK